MRIEGHTDDVGDAFANLDLSQRRADAVRAYLIARGVEPDRLLAVGHGESRPVVAGTDEAARGTNRRVEFYVETWNTQGRTP
jgi:outer membrane protein OmpA-like peptidoglycan-associated protein